MKNTAGLWVITLGWIAVGHAEVRETAANSFVVESSALTAASPARTYAALGKVAGWWNPQHTWSGAAKNLSLQLRAGGCFCEKLAGGGSVEHGHVVFADPGKMLRINGALGPFQEMAVNGILTFALTPENSGTRITLKYSVSGAISMDTKQLAPGVDQVMGGQLARLKAYVDQAREVKKNQ
jgi:uncharacterized protein YndB with AHSA1/START domain